MARPPGSRRRPCRCRACHARRPGRRRGRSPPAAATQRPDRPASCRRRRRLLPFHRILRRRRRWPSESEADSCARSGRAESNPPGGPRRPPSPMDRGHPRRRPGGQARSGKGAIPQVSEGYETWGQVNSPAASWQRISSFHGFEAMIASTQGNRAGGSPSERFASVAAETTTIRDVDFGLDRLRLKAVQHVDRVHSCPLAGGGRLFRKRTPKGSFHPLRSPPRLRLRPPFARVVGLGLGRPAPRPWFGRGRRLDVRVRERREVHVEGGRRTCECKGFDRWHHCRHADGLTALIAAGRL